MELFAFLLYIAQLFVLLGLIVSIMHSSIEVTDLFDIFILKTCG